MGVHRGSTSTRRRNLRSAPVVGNGRVNSANANHNDNRANENDNGGEKTDNKGAEIPIQQR